MINDDSKSKKNKYSAQAKYAKEKTKTYGFSVMLNTEKDIYEKLEKQENKSGYIKSLILKDLYGLAKR